MFTDPVLQQVYATRNLTEMIRAGERERLADRVSPWYRPLVAALTPVRLAVGAGIIRAGRVIQGATAIPAAPRPTAKL